MDIKHDETTSSKKAHETTTKLVCSDHGITAASKDSSKLWYMRIPDGTDDENGIRGTAAQEARRRPQ